MKSLRGTENKLKLTKLRNTHKNKIKKTNPKIQQTPFKVASCLLQRNLSAVAHVSVKSRNPSSHLQLINLCPKA